MDSISALVDGLNPRRQMVAGRVLPGHSTVTKIMNSISTLVDGINLQRLIAGRVLPGHSTAPNGFDFSFG